MTGDDRRWSGTARPAAVEHIRALIAATLAEEPDDAATAPATQALGAERTALVVSAAFAYAVMQRFRDGTPIEVVRDWVRAARAELENPDEMPHLLVEGLIRSILGEDDLARGVPMDRRLAIEAWLIFQLVTEVHPTAVGQNRFLTDVTRFAQDWLNEADQRGSWLAAQRRDPFA